MHFPDICTACTDLLFRISRSGMDLVNFSISLLRMLCNSFCSFLNLSGHRIHFLCSCCGLLISGCKFLRDTGYTVDLVRKFCQCRLCCSNRFIQCIRFALYIADQMSHIVMNVTDAACKNTDLIFTFQVFFLHTMRKIALSHFFGKQRRSFDARCNVECKIQYPYIREYTHNNHKIEKLILFCFLFLLHFLQYRLQFLLYFFLGIFRMFLTYIFFHAGDRIITDSTHIFISDNYSI